MQKHRPALPLASGFVAQRGRCKSFFDNLKSAGKVSMGGIDTACDRSSFQSFQRCTEASGTPSTTSSFSHSVLASPSSISRQNSPDRAKDSLKDHKGLSLDSPTSSPASQLHSRDFRNFSNDIASLSDGIQTLSVGQQKFCLGDASDPYGSQTRSFNRSKQPKCDYETEILDSCSVDNVPSYPYDMGHHQNPSYEPRTKKRIAGKVLPKRQTLITVDNSTNSIEINNSAYITCDRGRRHKAETSRSAGRFYTCDPNCIFSSSRRCSNRNGRSTVEHAVSVKNTGTQGSANRVRSKNGEHATIFEMHKAQSNKDLPSTCEISFVSKETYTDGEAHAIYCKNHERCLQESSAKFATFAINDGLPEITKNFDDTVLRVTEIDLFRKRFPKAKTVSDGVFIVNFSPSDPDWPFDVRDLNLQVIFPAGYPRDLPSIRIINVDEVLPSLLIQDIESAINRWFKDQEHTPRLMFRPFLRWFDRNLQDIFFEGLQKVKRSINNVIIDTDRLPASNEETCSKTPKTGENGSLMVLSANTIADNLTLRALPKKHERLQQLFEDPDSFDRSRSEGTIKLALQGGIFGTNQLTKILNNYDPHSVSRKGIEIKFRHVDLTESVTFIICDRFLVSVQCKKCKKTGDFLLLPGRRSVLHCLKCQTKLEACFRPSIFLQFNPILGYLELQDCTIRDVALSRCHFYIDCQICSKLSPLDRVHVGQRCTLQCMSCNVKMQILMDSIKFIDMRAVEANVKASQLKRVNKDSAIQAGKPLPGNGVCKHYKKSFRWFRFPCCGKAYPCDDCHNEQEVDHIAEFASRMICGFCAKEQPFSNDRPCAQCSNLITGRRTTHWEGGKGCRSKIKMSSNDSKKYSGRNKTLSKKNFNKK